MQIGTRRVEPSAACFIAAEAGSNHDGKLEQAFALIDVAADTGVDAVKFQLFGASRIYPANCGVVDTPAGREDFFELLKG